MGDEKSIGIPEGMFYKGNEVKPSSKKNLAIFFVIGIIIVLIVLAVIYYSAKEDKIHIQPGERISESEAESIVLKEIESIGGGEILSTKFYENYSEGIYVNSSKQTVYVIDVKLNEPIPRESGIFKGIKEAEEKYRKYILEENGHIITYFSLSSYEGGNE